MTFVAKKIALSVLAALAAIALFAAPASAQIDLNLFPECDQYLNASGNLRSGFEISDLPVVCQSALQTQDDPGAGIFGPDSLASQITQTIIFVAGAISVLMIAVGGLRYVLSGGDQQGTASAKNTILYAVIGLVITLAAEAIYVLILQRL